MPEGGLSKSSARPTHPTHDHHHQCLSRSCENQETQLSARQHGEWWILRQTLWQSRAGRVA